MKKLSYKFVITSNVHAVLSKGLEKEVFGLLVDGESHTSYRHT